MMFDGFPCEVVTSKPLTIVTFGAYVFNKKSPYVELFNHHIQRIKQTGLETEWFNQQIISSIQCGDKSAKYFFSFSYNELMVTFFIFGLGCLTSILYLATERMYRKRKLQQRRYS